MYGSGGLIKVEKKVMGRRSWAAVGFSLIFGVVFGDFRYRATRAHYPKPCLGNNFLMRSASEDLNSPCCSRDHGLKIHPVSNFMNRRQSWSNFCCKVARKSPKSMFVARARALEARFWAPWAILR